MDLCANQVRALGANWLEQCVPRRSGNEQDVVRRCLRLGPRRRTDLLEERVGLWEVDDTIDPHASRRVTCAADRDGVAGHDAQIRGGLLGDEHARSGAGEIADRAGKGLAVPVGQAEHHARSGCLG